MSARMTSVWLRACELTLLAMAFMLPVAFCLSTYDGTELKAALFEAGTLALAFGWLLKGLERGRWELPSAARPLAAPALALLAWTLARFAAQPHKAAALPGMLVQALGLVTYLIVLLEFGGADMARRMLGWLWAAAWASGLYGLAQKLGFDPWGRLLGSGVMSSFAEPGFFGFFLALCVPLTLAQWLDVERDWFLRWADLALLALLGFDLTATRSLEALVALSAMAACAALLFPLLLPSRGAAKASGLSLLLLAAVWIAARRAIPSAGAQLGAERLAWRTARAMIADSPWTGEGPGSFSAQAPSFAAAELKGRGGAPSSPQGLLLQTAAELGLVGAGLWLWLFGALAAAVWKARRQFVKQGALGESWCLAALSAAVLGFVVSAQFGGASQSLMPGWLLWPLAGALGGLTMLSRRSAYISVLPLPLGETARRRLYAPALLAFAALLVWPARWFDSELERNQAEASARAGHWEAAIERCGRVRPGAPSYLAALALEGDAYLASERPRQALAAYAALRAQSPDYGRVHFQEATAYAALEDWRAAAQAYERQLALEPADVPAFSGLAQADKRLGDLPGAERAAANAVALEPANPAHRLALAEIYLKEKRVAAARKLERQAARLRGALRSKKSG